MAQLYEKVEQYRMYLQRVAAKAGAGNAAGDAVQDAYIELASRSIDHREIRSWRAFLATVVRRKAWRYRKEQRQARQGTTGEHGDHGEGARQIEDRVLLHETWGTLTSEERATVEALRDTGSQSEAARKLGVRRQRVNRVLNRVRAKTGDA